MNPVRRLLRLALTASVAACAKDTPPVEPTSHLLAVDTIAPADAGVFFRPADMVVLPEGELAVLEYTPSSIIVIDPSTGTVVRNIGSPGKGPGQLIFPLGLQLIADTLVTLNVGNARVERYLADGQIPGSTRAPVGVNIGRVALNPDGGMLIPTAGADGTLLRVLTAAGTLAHRIGAPRVPPTRQFDIGAFRELAEQLKVPDYYGNDVLAAMTVDSVFWLAFGAVPELAAYASDGSTLASIRVPDSLSVPILEDYRKRNREAAESIRFHQLAYFADIRVAGDFVWALLRNPVDADARVLLVHRTEGLVADLVFPGAKDVWRIAPDPLRGVIYLSSASASEVYRAVLPEGVGR